MSEEQSSQESELADGIVRVTHRLVALLSKDANSHVRLLNHVHIIRPIAYGQCDRLWLTDLDHLNYLGLLTRRCSADNDCLAFAKDAKEGRAHALRILNEAQRLSLDKDAELVFIVDDVVVTFRVPENVGDVPRLEPANVYAVILLNVPLRGGRSVNVGVSKDVLVSVHIERHLRHQVLLLPIEYLVFAHEPLGDRVFVRDDLFQSLARFPSQNWFSCP